TVEAAGVHIDGILQEAITIGGGTITNHAGGIITSFERAITVDDSNLGNAFASTTIDNSGLIHGGNGEAIALTDTFADTIINKGVVEGSVATGGGDDIFNLYTGSSITGLIDGGDGHDTINLLGKGIGAATDFVSVEAVNLLGGDWTLGSESATSVNFAG